MQISPLMHDYSTSVLSVCRAIVHVQCIFLMSAMSTVYTAVECYLLLTGRSPPCATAQCTYSTVAWCGVVQCQIATPLNDVHNMHIVARVYRVARGHVTAHIYVMCRAKISNMATHF